MKRRAAVEPVISHVKADHRMDRNYLKGQDGDPSTPSSPPPVPTSTSS
jgi:IS5 family transposase